MKNRLPNGAKELLNILCSDIIEEEYIDKLIKLKNKKRTARIVREVIEGIQERLSEAFQKGAEDGRNMERGWADDI